MADARTLRWRGATLATLFTGYAGYYICRSNLSVSMPLILDEFPDPVGAKRVMGLVATIGLVLYAIGKVTNGLWADFVGGRPLFLLGMFASVACTVLFGLSGGLLAFTVLWAANRYVQSMGWVALVKTASCWFPFRVQATVLGALSMSYLLGDAFARWYLGRVMSWGVGWRGVFFVSAATLASIGIVACFTLRSTPSDVGLEEPAANPDNVFGAEGDAAKPESLGRLLPPLLRSIDFWLICALNFGLTLIRATFNLWTPTYLTEVTDSTAADAAGWSMLFPLVGAVAALLAGLLSDRLEGRHGRIIVPSMALLIGALVLLAVVRNDGRLAIVMPMICVVSFALLAPYSYLSGVVALDLGGKQGSATAAGLIDSAGYLGSALSGVGIAEIAVRWGWSYAFGSLALVAALTTVAAVAYWLRQEWLPSKRRDRSASETST